MLFITKILRGFIKVYLNVSNILRFFFIRIKYPNVKISFNVRIEKGASIKCSDNSKINIVNSIISSGTLIQADHGGEIVIKNSFIGRNCVIVAREKIIIESDCQIAEMVVVRDQNHNFDHKGAVIAKQGFNTSPVIIEENVWLAAKVTVLSGSNIGKNTVVGANAVVNGNLEGNSVYVGVPVKKVKSF